MNMADLINMTDLKTHNIETDMLALRETIIDLLQGFLTEVKEDYERVSAFVLPILSPYLDHLPPSFTALANQLLQRYSNNEDERNLILLSASLFTFIALVGTMCIFQRQPPSKTTFTSKPFEIVSNKRISNAMHSSAPMGPSFPASTTARSSTVREEAKDTVIFMPSDSPPPDHPRPLPDYNENPSETGLTLEQETSFQLITSGTVLIKHSQSAGPSSSSRHIRHVAVSEDLKSICWRPLGVFTESGKLPLSSFQRCKTYYLHEQCPYHLYLLLLLI